MSQEKKPLAGETVPAEDFYQLLLLATDLASSAQERFVREGDLWRDTGMEKVARHSGLVLATAFPQGSWMHYLKVHGLIHEPNESIVRMMETARKLVEKMEQERP